MKSSTTYVSNLTTIGDGTQHMIGYAQNAQAGYIEAPTNAQQQDGVVPLDRLPAQWWNWFLNKATRRFTESEDFLENAVAELDNVLDVMGITPDPTSTTQLKTMFSSNYLQQYLPKIAAQASAFSVDGTHENYIPVADDDGNSGFSVKKVPYAPGFILTTQLGSAAKTLTLPSNCPFDGQTIKICFANGHEAGNSTDYMTLNVNSTGPVPIVSNQNGTLANLPIHELTAGTYSVLMANVTLEMYYTSNGFNSNPAWVVIGNPVVLSSTNYTIYANGQIGNEPIGTIIAQYKKSNPLGYLYLDGSTFDTTKYANLYAYLGTDTLPDYREFALVGAEQNSHDTIYSHDVYTQGQSKDDQYQGHSHMLSYDEDQSHWKNTLDITIPASQNYADGAAQMGTNPTLVQQLSIKPNPTWAGGVYHERWGDVTRGKRKAVFWYIKY